MSVTDGCEEVKMKDLKSRFAFGWMGAIVLAMAVSLAAGPPEEARKKEIGYISPEIPEVKFPPLKGEWQEGLVPDTLDLAERARLSINALTESADPEAGYEIWWHSMIIKGSSVVFIDPPRKVLSVLSEGPLSAEPGAMGEEKAIRGHPVGD